MEGWAGWPAKNGGVGRVARADWARPRWPERTRRAPGRGPADWSVAAGRGRVDPGGRASARWPAVSDDGVADAGSRSTTTAATMTDAHAARRRTRSLDAWPQRRPTRPR